MFGMRFIKSACALTVLGTCGICSAETTWSGFLSVATGKTMDDDTTYTVDGVTGAVYTHEFQTEPESVVGLQAQSIISDTIRTTVQMVSKGYTGYQVDVDLAFVSFSVSDEWTVNAGRYRLPFYYYSDFIDVGYAYHWVRAPMDYYNIPHTSLDGFNTRYSSFLGDSDFELEAQIWYGNSNIEFDLGDTIGQLEVRDDMGFATLLTWNWLAVRLLHNQKDITARFDGFPATPDGISYQSMGIIIDYDNFILRSEYAKQDSDSALESSTSNYISLGYRLGNFLPHVTLSQNDPGESFDFSGAPALINSVDDSVTFGVRWDALANTAFKLEYTSRDSENVITDLSLAPPGSTTLKSDVSVLSFAIDLVF